MRMRMLYWTGNPFIHMAAPEWHMLCGGKNYTRPLIAFVIRIHRSHWRLRTNGILAEGQAG